MGRKSDYRFVFGIGANKVIRASTRMTHAGALRELIALAPEGAARLQRVLVDVWGARSWLDVWVRDPVKCPICGYRARCTKPRMRLLRWTCLSCGWHFTQPSERP
jgi:hypothetical protein